MSNLNPVRRVVTGLDPDGIREGQGRDRGQQQSKRQYLFHGKLLFTGGIGKQRNTNTPDRE